MFARLSREPAAERAGRTMEPLPGWWRRRQRALAPAREVLTQLPSGPVRVTTAPGERTVVDERRSPVSPPPAVERRPASSDRQSRPDHGGRTDRRNRPPRQEGARHDRPGFRIARTANASHRAARLSRGVISAAHKSRAIAGSRRAAEATSGAGRPGGLWNAGRRGQNG